MGDGEVKFYHRHHRADLYAPTVVPQLALIVYQLAHTRHQVVAWLSYAVDSHPIGIELKCCFVSKLLYADLSTTLAVRADDATIGVPEVYLFRASGSTRKFPSDE